MKAGKRRTIEKTAPPDPVFPGMTHGGKEMPPGEAVDADGTPDHPGWSDQKAGRLAKSSSIPANDTERGERWDELYRAAVERAPDVIALLQNGRVLFINDRVREIFGYSPEEVRSLSPLQFVHPDDRLMAQENYYRRLEGKEEVPAGYSFRFLTREGSDIWVNMNAAVVTWREQPALLIFLRDMTHQNRIEARMIQAQKLEALGTLAEGIAHDFNNILMSIQGYASLALMEGDPSTAVTARVKKIQELVRNGAELTVQLLGFSGTARYEVLPVNLNDIISGSSLMVERSNRTISLHRNLMNDLWQIRADRGQIEQALMNLLVNASQSMPGGGDLYIETDNVMLTQADDACRLLRLDPGSYVHVSVTDTGIGIDEAIKKRIFDPFFTTRELGMGTGLGLPSAYGIVRAHGGTIEVTSRLGQGARFDVYLPALEVPAANVDSDSIVGNEQGMFKEAILIVDDERLVLEVNRELLESQGYRVFEAQGGREALEIYGRSQNEIDLVLLDLIMPGMSGAETYHGLKEINPHVKVVLLSGYSIEGGAVELLKEGCRAFIQKPFTVDHFTKKLRDVLDDKQHDV